MNHKVIVLPVGEEEPPYKSPAGNAYFELTASQIGALLQGQTVICDMTGDGYWVVLNFTRNDECAWESEDE